MVDEDLAASLRAAYGLPGANLRRVLGGQATVNYAGTAGGRQVFVKRYLPGVDLQAEEAAIELSAFAAKRGVPTARVVRAASGSVIYRRGEARLSVWELVAGEPGGAAAMGPRRMAAVGGVVGQLHRVLAGHPTAPATLGPASGVCDVARSTRRFETMVAQLSQMSERDEFLAWAAEVLRWRLSIMPRIADMLSGLPPLTSQIAHGDLASPNVLFSDDEVAALIDFRPPRARPVAWELSRIGCDPRTILHGEAWLHGLKAMATTYRTAYPDVRAEDVLAAVPTWICYTASSEYPYNELLLGQSLLPDQLQVYARDRQQALIAVMENLTCAQDALREGIDAA